jgi:hypothetical protein
LQGGNGELEVKNGRVDDDEMETKHWH